MVLRSLLRSGVLPLSILLGLLLPVLLLVHPSSVAAAPSSLAYAAPTWWCYATTNNGMFSPYSGQQQQPCVRVPSFEVVKDSGTNWKLTMSVNTPAIANQAGYSADGTAQSPRLARTYVFHMFCAGHWTSQQTFTLGASASFYPSILIFDSFTFSQGSGCWATDGSITNATARSQFGYFVTNSLYAPDVLNDDWVAWGGLLPTTPTGRFVGQAPFSFSGSSNTYVSSISYAFPTDPAPNPTVTVTASPSPAPTVTLTPSPAPTVTISPSPYAPSDTSSWWDMGSWMSSIGNMLTGLVVPSDGFFTTQFVLLKDDFTSHPPGSLVTVAVSAVTGFKDGLSNYDDGDCTRHINKTFPFDQSPFTTNTPNGLPPFIGSLSCVPMASSTAWGVVRLVMSGFLVLSLLMTLWGMANKAFGGTDE